MPKLKRQNFAETNRGSYYKQEEWLKKLLDGKGAFYNGSGSNDSDNDDDNYNENNEQQELSEGFVNSWYKIVSPILLQELINDFAVYKYCSGTLLQPRFWKPDWHISKRSHTLIDQPVTCRFFVLCWIKSIFLSNLVTSLVYTE